MQSQGDENRTRVLILAPTTRDARVSEAFLGAAGIDSVVCASMNDLVAALRQGAATVLMTDDALVGPGVDQFLHMMRNQPAWSDLPIVLLASANHQIEQSVNIAGSLTNLTVLERPALARTVVSAVQAASRARMRQYQIRDQLEQLRVAAEERTRLLESEQSARREAERASHLKDEFLATLSHELRTPLTAVLGWAQILRRGKIEPRLIDEGLAVIERNARAQSELISDLLDMSRIISGKVRIELQQVDIVDLTRTVLESVRPAAEAKDLTIRFRADISPGVVHGDPQRLQQVIWNLLTNAIKFTPRSGRVEVCIERRADVIVLQVSDSGKGIAPEFLPHVFERFRQADASTTRSQGGLGLGLSIVKHLVDMHGGSIEAYSEGENRGAMFTVRLPVFERTIPTEGSGSPGTPALSAIDSTDIDLEGVRVLLVDDEPDSRTLLKMILDRCHARVTSAASVDEALAELRTFSPDVIVSDIGMPNRDGYDFMSAVRRQGLQAPAIALTAFAREEDRLRGLRAGFQAHLAKPIESTELVTAVAQVVGRVRKRS